jgi:2-keto-3-deoxy-galactonokinase
MHSHPNNAPQRSGEGAKLRGEAEKLIGHGFKVCINTHIYIYGHSNMKYVFGASQRQRCSGVYMLGELMSYVSAKRIYANCCCGDVPDEL